MKIDYHREFQKNYLKRIKRNRNLNQIFHEKVILFVEDLHNPILKDHALVGKQRGLRSFSITGDVRVVYRPIKKNLVLFLDIGSHNQVY